MSENLNLPAGESKSPQCQFFVLRKKRLCRMTVKPGRQYCGEHQPQPEADGAQVDNRIPCPNDPKHTVFASKLLKHLAICNARRTEQPSYIVQNINAPDIAKGCPRKPLSAIPRDEIVKLIDKVNHLYCKYIENHITTEPEHAIHHTVQPEFNEPDRAESSLRHLRQTSSLLWITEQAGLVGDGTCYVELGAGKGQLSYYACHAWCGGNSSRVLAVDRAPLRHKRDNKLRSNPPTRSADLESGHERDNTSKHADEAKGNEVVDSYSNRKKAKLDHNESPKFDTENREVNVESDSTGNRSGVTTNNDSIVKCSDNDDGCTDSDVAVRLRADLAHLALHEVPVVKECQAVVGFAKHLCGVATDYALHCIASDNVVHKTRGLVLATCCHHRCEHALYVANRQLEDFGISAEDFNILLGIVSWATCGDGRSRERRKQDTDKVDSTHSQNSDEVEEKTPKYPICREEREVVGRRAKALLDWGRVLYLKERGFNARLSYYVSRDVSLENVCIVADKINTQ